MAAFLDLDTPPWMMDLAFGPWQVIRELKTGGMGTVYLVSNHSEFGSRKFALKVIRKDLANDHLVSRFQRERTVLDQLDHPDIVKIVDRGQTDAGESYFVMKYVEGQPITEYCAEEQLPIRERVRLSPHMSGGCLPAFEAVCASRPEALQHFRG